MFKELSILSFYNLMYPEEDSASNLSLPLPLLPISYNSNVSNEGENPASMFHFEEYDDSYLVGEPCLVPPLSSLTNGNNMKF